MIIIYHKNCTDGWCAAYLMNRAYPDAQLIAASYGDKPPDTEGHDVVIVDFSYPYGWLEQIRDLSNSLIVLDHHESARTDLESTGGLQYVYDPSRSGAAIVWSWLLDKGHLDTTPQLTEIVRYVQDYDLWRFELPDSRDYNNAINSYEYSIGDWDKLSVSDPEFLILEGGAITRRNKKLVSQALVNSYYVMFRGVKIPLVNSSILGNEIAEVLYQDHPFACVYHFDSETFKFSLRSGEFGTNVRQIAEQFGGGGHDHAASFKALNLDWVHQ